MRTHTQEHDTKSYALCCVMSRNVAMFAIRVSVQTGTRRNERIGLYVWFAVFLSDVFLCSYFTHSRDLFVITAEKGRQHATNIIHTCTFSAYCLPLIYSSSLHTDSKAWIYIWATVISIPPLILTFSAVRFTAFTDALSVYFLTAFYVCISFVSGNQIIFRLYLY